MSHAMSKNEAGPSTLHRNTKLNAGSKLQKTVQTNRRSADRRQRKQAEEDEEDDDEDEESDGFGGGDEEDVEMSEVDTDEEIARIKSGDGKEKKERSESWLRSSSFLPVVMCWVLLTYRLLPGGGRGLLRRARRLSRTRRTLDVQSCQAGMMGHPPRLLHDVCPLPLTPFFFTSRASFPTMILFAGTFHTLTSRAKEASNNSRDVRFHTDGAPLRAREEAQTIRPRGSRSSRRRRGRQDDDDREEVETGQTARA